MKFWRELITLFCACTCATSVSPQQEPDGKPATIANEPAPRPTRAERALAQLKPRDDIFNAAATGNLARLQQLLDLGFDINAKSKIEQQTPLLAAVRKNQIEIANFLLDRGANPLEPDIVNDTPLHFAAHWGANPLVERLIAAGADVNATNNNGRAPIHYAARRGLLPTVKILISHGAEFNQPSGLDAAPIDLALGFPNPDFASFLIHSGARLTDTPENAEARIRIAIAKNWIPILTAILDQASNQKELSNRLNSVAVDVALSINNREVLNTLAGRGVTIPDRTSSGTSRLFQACSVGNVHNVRALLSEGADPNQRVQLSGWAPIHAAAQKGLPESIALLAGASADVNATDGLGRTPLHIAAAERRPDAITALLEAGADPNRQDFRGHTPLHYAATLGDQPVVESLIRAGARLDIADRDGLLPRDAAERNGHSHIVAMLTPPNLPEQTLPDGFDMLVRALANNDTRPRAIEHTHQKLASAARAGVPLVHLAVMQRSAPALTQLLDAQHASASDRDAAGYLPLHIAAGIGDQTVIDTLIGKTSNINDAANLAKWTPLHFAAAAGHNAAVKALLAANADPAATDALGNTPAAVARLAGHPDTARLLE